MADYCSTSDLQSDFVDSPFSSSTDSAYLTSLADCITAASRMIDREVGRWDNYFYPSTDTETRYFDSDGGESLFIDECLSITSLSVSEYGYLDSTSYTLWGSTEYFTFPYNKLPILELNIDPGGSKYYFPNARKAIKIIGIFGRSLTVPVEIKRACKIQATRWFMRAKQAYQDASMNQEMGTLLYAQQLDPDIKTILNPYKLENMV